MISFSSAKRFPHPPGVECGPNLHENGTRALGASKPAALRLRLKGARVLQRAPMMISWLVLLLVVAVDDSFTEAILFFYLAISLYQKLL